MSTMVHPAVPDLICMNHLARERRDRPGRCHRDQGYSSNMPSLFSHSRSAQRTMRKRRRIVTMLLVPLVNAKG